MNDVKYKKSIKRSFILFGIGLFVIFLMLIYTSLSPDSKTTIYDEYDVSQDMSAGVSKVYLESKGIKKEEFEKYLSVAAILVRDDIKLNLNDEEKENYKYMQAVINLQKEVIGTDLEVNETTNESFIYNKDVENVLKEFVGKYFKDGLNVENYFKFTEDELGNKFYVVKEQEDFVSYMIELTEVELNGDLIEVKFKNVFGTNDEITKLINKEKVSLNTYEFKAIVKENLSYDLAKYYINDIEILNVEKKDYNN